MIYVISSDPESTYIHEQVIHLVRDETNLVIAGAWNPAILTPEWFIRHALQRPPGSAVRVSAQVPAGAGLVLDFPRYTLEGLTFSARPDALILAPATTDEESLTKIENAARNILLALNHTPVAGMGQNFEFRDPAPTQDALNAFTQANLPLADHVPNDWSVQAASLNTTYRRGDVLVNVSRQFAENQFTVKFNFHHDVNSAQQCLTMLGDARTVPSMFNNYHQARSLLSDCFGGVQDENELETSV